MTTTQTVLAAAEEMSDSTFLAYIGGLAVSGVLLLILAALPGEAALARVINVLVGLGFLGYAFYLFFIFDGGEVRVFYYIFAVPVLLIIRTVQNFRARRAGAQAAADTP